MVHPTAVALSLMTIVCHGLVAPSPLQVRFLDWKMTAFHHFSITTFTGSQSGDQDPSLFAPDSASLNLTQWAEVAKSMGAPVAVLTSKHEAGYIIWQTDEPIGRNFSIRQSSTVASRDLVREFTDACREVGILPGLYFTTTDAYQTFMNVSDLDRRKAQLQQITELSTRYGEIAYFWFDHHAVASPADLWYDIDLLVRKNQPNAVLLGLDTSQVGGESGVSPYPWWYACDTIDGSSHGRCLPNQTARGNPNGAFFKSAESDCSIFQGCHPWFCCGTVQTLEQSMAHWESTVGRGSEFIMNVPPNKTGLIDSELVQSTALLGAKVSERYGRYGNNLSNASGSSVGAVSGAVAVGGSLTLMFEEPSCVDRILLTEALAAGQRVAKYSLEADSGDAKWVSIPLNSSTGGQTVGVRHLDVLGEAWVGRQLSGLRLKLEQAMGTEAAAVPMHMSMVAFCVDRK